LVLIDDNRFYFNSTGVSVGTYPVKIFITDDDSKNTVVIQEAILELKITIYSLEF